MTEQPVIFAWDGESMVPASSLQARRADEQFVVGQKYALIEQHERSNASHGHYFAVLHELWVNLPEQLQGEFPNEEVLRAHALIATGYAQKRQLVLRSKRAARQVAAFIAADRPLSIIDVDGYVVTEWTPESQAYRAMGKTRFQASKDAVLGWIADRLGLPADADERSAA